MPSGSRLNDAGMIVYLNGDFLPLEDACISPMDRGFLFGDGVYEVIPAYNNRLFRIDEHLQRLQNSLDAIRLKNPYSAQQWIDIFNTLVSHQDHSDHSIYLQITRGADSKRDHTIPDHIEPTVFIVSNPFPPLPDISDLSKISGVRVMTQEDSRWQHCNVKAITLLANILHRQDAIDDGYAETILIRDGYALEGSASNLFIVKEGIIKTPPKSSLLLPGITRDLVLEIAAQNNVAAQEADISSEDLFEADEVWVTSSTKEIVPVVQVDTDVIGDGAPGPVWKKMITRFQEYKKQLVA